MGGGQINLGGCHAKLNSEICRSRDFWGASASGKGVAAVVDLVHHGVRCGRYQYE